MQVYHLLSLSAIIAFSIAIFSCKRVPRNKNDIVYIAQVIGYLLMAISMVSTGQYAAMVAFISCATTLWLKMKKKYTAIKFLTFWLLTLIISLIVNGKGWVGMLPVVASLDII